MRIALTQTLLVCLLAACSPLAAAAPTWAVVSPAASSATPGLPTDTPLPSATSTSTPLPSATPRAPDDWKNWPEIPAVPGSVQAIYNYGQQLGNDPQAFSVLGDCQSLPDVFLGVYDRDPQTVASLPPDLQETVAYFAGSFDRPSPTVRSGTTAAALLWSYWTEGKYGCRPNETPLACELRIHRPSFAFIHVGTHYEDRNMTYLQRIVAQLIDHGVVPILVTKADDREGDDRINHDYALLAVQYNLPLWNFWVATAGLPDRGLYIRPELRFLGDIYLTEPARLIHRLSALQALNTVWRALRTAP